MDLADQYEEAANVVAELRAQPRKGHCIELPPLLKQHIAKSGDWVPPLELAKDSRQLMSECYMTALELVIARLQQQGFPNAGLEMCDGKPHRIVFEKEENDPRN